MSKPENRADHNPNRRHGEGREQQCVAQFFDAVGSDQRSAKLKESGLAVVTTPHAPTGYGDSEFKRRMSA